MNFTIWQNVNLNIEDWKMDLEELYPDSTESELYDYMYEINDSYLDDERHNLNIKLEGPILILGDIGCWDGRKVCFKLIKDGCIASCLYDNSCDYMKWYCDNYNLRFKGYHHDGSNYYLYREVKPGLSIRQLDNFFNKLNTKGLSDNDIKRYTRSLRPYIANVYGIK